VPAFSPPAILAGQTAVAAAHIAEIRADILALW
jgi:hypothetical protein